MTTTEIVRLLKGRRYAKGKWMARCPAHNEKTGSMSITEMPGGNTRLHCFAGCHQKDIIDALGLSWKDLRINREADPEIIRQIREQESLRLALRERRTELLWEFRKKADLWERRAQVYAQSLIKRDSDHMARLFNHALHMHRLCWHIWENL